MSTDNENRVRCTCSSRHHTAGWHDLDCPTRSASVSAVPVPETVTLPKALLGDLLEAALRVILLTPNSPALERLAGTHHDVELAWVGQSERTP